MMIPTSLTVVPKQEKRIFKALRGRKGCRIKVKKCAGGTDRLLLSPGHIKKYRQAAHGSVVTLPFSHKHLVENSGHQGGFLPLLAAVLGPVLGGVAGGLLGRGIGLKKKKRKRRRTAAATKKTKRKKKANNGRGMYLNPWRHAKTGSR